VLIRRATAADVDAVVALVESAYRGDSSRAGWTTEADLLDGQRTDADEVRSLLDDLVVADADGELVGCCTLIPRGDHAYFGMFAVRPGLQAAASAHGCSRRRRTSPPSTARSAWR
jgi:N-acetylglutamate synthase-like GNAT family acetyltransferase